MAITPTKLAKAYTDAGYFERNLRAIEVLIDQDTLKQAVADGELWRYYDLGHGLCTYESFDQCAHRMACARCDIYRPRESMLVQFLHAKDILRFLQQFPLSDEKRAAVDGDLNAIDRLTQRLADKPTSSGQTPEELHCFAVSPQSETWLLIPHSNQQPKLRCLGRRLRRQGDRHCDPGSRAPPRGHDQHPRQLLPAQGQA